MAGITLTQAEELLSLWIEADKAVATGQSYSIGGRSLTRANAAEITNKIKFYSNLVGSLSRGGINLKRVVPRDV
jgi:hypothetical protein